MYRIVRIAVFACAAITLPAETSLAFGLGHAPGTSGSLSERVTPVASQVAVKPGRGTPTPQVKKLSAKAGAACFRACMHGVDSSWGNFCDYSCYGP